MVLNCFTVQMSGNTPSLRDKFLWEDPNNKQQVVTFSFLPCKNWQLITNGANVCVERTRARQAPVMTKQCKQIINSNPIVYTALALDIPPTTTSHLFTFEKFASQVASTPGCQLEMLQDSRINLQTSHALGSHWVYLSVQDHLCNILGVIVSITTK